jgi:plasmid stability protein
MSAVTVRNLSDEVRRALKLRAVQHGRSTEAEIRTILEAAVKPKLGLGTQLAAIGRSIGGANIEIRRDPTPVKPARFA